MDLEEVFRNDQRCLRIVSSKIRSFVITGFETPVSVTALLIILYACAQDRLNKLNEWCVNVLWHYVYDSDHVLVCSLACS
jgi:hypothetical protein